MGWFTEPVTETEKQQMTADIQAMNDRIDTLVQELLNPIGSIILLIGTDVNPADLGLPGTWEEY